jgi:hypothetical protein
VRRAKNVIRQFSGNAYLDGGKGNDDILDLERRRGQNEKHFAHGRRSRARQLRGRRHHHELRELTRP